MSKAQIMKKLDDIPKKEIFNTPEGYFESLPGIIQSRVAEQKRHTGFAFQLKWQYAIPVVIVVIVAIVWFIRPFDSATDKPENLLASVEIQDLINYLHETDVTMDELLDHVSLDLEETEELEDFIYEFTGDSINTDEM